MEAKAIEFHQKVRDLYLQQARSHPDKIVVVNAAGGIQAIHRQIRQIIETRRFRESTE
jgi:dTMP kinase